MERILVVTADDVLLEELLRVVAAAGGQADVSADVGHVRARWRLAPVVLLGADLLARAVRAGLPRREHTIVVCAGDPEPDVWARAVDVGACRVVGLPTGEGLLVDAIADVAEAGAAPGVLVGVVGGRGGAGASVLTTGLAVAAARAGHEVLVVDGDPLGGGLDLLFGAEHEPGLRWNDLRDVSGRLAAVALRQALPTAHGVSLLSHQRSGGRDPGPEAMLAVTRTGRRAGSLVLVDLPRAVEPGSAAAIGSADRVLLVVPADLRSCAAAGRVADAVCALTPLVQVVVRVWRSAPLTPDAVAAALQLPLAAVLRPDASLATAVEDGSVPGVRGRGALAACARALLRDLHLPTAPRAA